MLFYSRYTSWPMIWIYKKQHIFLSATKQLYECLSPSVCLWHLFHNVPIIASSWNFLELLPITEVTALQTVKGRGQRSRSHKSQPNLTVSGPSLQFEFTKEDEMMHKAWCCLGKALYCFSMSSVKLQGHTGQKSSNLIQIGRFGTVTPVWIHKWPPNDAQSLK